MVKRIINIFLLYLTYALITTIIYNELQVWVIVGITNLIRLSNIDLQLWKEGLKQFSLPYLKCIHYIFVEGILSENISSKCLKHFKSVRYHNINFSMIKNKFHVVRPLKL